MKDYLETDLFVPPQKTLIYVERDTPFLESRGDPARRGLMIALDLERYDWKADTPHPPMIRPTEGTVSERLPPRMEIRRGAPLEIPHIIVLIDDKENTLLPALGNLAKCDDVMYGGAKCGDAKQREISPLYDAGLMLNSGRIRGWKLDREEHWDFLASGLEKLAAGKPFLYAVGDGNHSLAAAKAVWEEYKNAGNDPDIMSHPARWALVELENLHDPALVFEPIHRLLFGIDAAAVQQVLAALPGYCCRKVDDPSVLAALVQDNRGGLLRLGLVSHEHCFLIEADPVPLAVDVVQPLLDTLENGKITIDYIHGSGELTSLAADKKNSGVGILLPPFRKEGLFETIARRGPLPRKSFSMGEACEKRFYLECRKLFG
jgi:hypothetical protein